MVCKFPTIGFNDKNEKRTLNKPFYYCGIEPGSFEWTTKNMEEMHIKSADLDVEEDPTTDNSGTFGSQQATPKESLHKIYRQGDKIYQLQDENVTMIKGVVSEKNTPECSEERVDEVPSGESLYKTFTFDNAISQEETEKCLTFWRSVVERNLEPIKCTLIENVAKMEAEAEEQKKLKKSQKKKSKTKKGELPDSEKNPCLEKTKLSVWHELLLELQKKRLNQTKLLMEKRCRFCEYANSPPYETKGTEKQTEEMINELATWQPRSYTRKDSLAKKGARASIGSEKGSKSSKTSRNKSGSVSSDIKEESNDVDDKEMNESFLNKIKEESAKMKYVDLIQEKKEKGLYSQWRQNKMKACECGRPECDCNKNPAIKAILESQNMSHDAENQACRVPKTASKRVVKKAEGHSDTETGIADEEKGQTDNNSPERTNSLLKQEGTSKQSSTNPLENITEIFQGSRKSDVSYLTDINTMREENSAEISYRNADEVLINTDYKEERPRKSILHKIDDFKEARKSKSKSLSVVLACVCEKEECDCKNILTLPEKEELSDHELPPPPSKVDRSVSLQKVNSLELIKKRLSSVGKIPKDFVMESEAEIENDIVRSQSFFKNISLAKLSADSLELNKKRISKISVKFGQEKEEDEILDRPRAVSIIE